MSPVPDGDLTGGIDPWMRDPDQLEQFILGALGNGDIKGVDYGLRFLALADPARAQRMYDDLQTALHVVAGGDVRMVWERVTPT